MMVFDIRGRTFQFPTVVLVFFVHIFSLHQKLDQFVCLCIKGVCLFQMFDWICHNRDVFLMNYVEIGHSYQVAKELQEEHNHFTMSSRVSSE